MLIIAVEGHSLIRMLAMILSLHQLPDITRELRLEFLKSSQSPLLLHKFINSIKMI